jgi:glycosyltransferase involved in cell wall biosynthesis
VHEVNSSANRTFGIVIPFFNNVGYLSQLTASLLNQSDGRFEVLIIDDSGENLIASEFLRYEPDDRFTLRTNEKNLGPILSWNAGLSQLLSRKRYKILSIVHGDDLLDCDYVKNAIKSLDEHPDVDIFHSKVKIIGSNGRRKFSLQDFVKSFANFGSFGKPVKSFGDKGLERILKNNFVFCPTMIFNVSKFHCIEFDTRWKMVGDLDFISQALLEGRSFLQLPDKNYYYRRHNNNLTAELTRTTKRFEEEIKLYGELESRCREAGFHKSAAVAKKARIIKLHITYRIMISLFRLDFSGFRRLFNVLLTIGK